MDGNALARTALDVEDDRSSRREPKDGVKARDPRMSSSSTGRGRFLRYTADRASVTYVMGAFALHVLVFAFASPLVAALCIVPLWFASILVAPLNHHHQHLGVFQSRILNRLYDLVLGLVTGIGPYTWVLHHNLGHHQNYLVQPPSTPPDESHWTRPDGTTMGRLEYSLHLFWHHQIDVIRVGKKHPKIFRAYLWMKVPLYAFIAAGLYLNALNFALAFLIPGMLTLLHTCWATHEHHAGHHAADHFSASVNREDKLFNVLSWNLGYHTAHHLRPGVHWSLLPELHASIRDKIPEEQLLPTFW
jgi:beta-carotene hydroxylase